MMLLLGIDPGKQGAIAWQCSISGAYGAVKMPPTAKQLHDFIAGLREQYGCITAYCEQVQVMGRAFGAKAALSYGQGYGEIIGILTALKASIVEVRPAAWKKKLNISADKESAILLCERIYPELDLTPGQCRKPQDGLAEAMLLIEWGKRAGVK